MKIARLLLLAALLLSAFSTTALAPDQAVGFIQLVSRPDEGTPMALQAHRALQRLMPQLLTAQADGQIIRFEPSLHSGVLKIVYRPSAGLPELAGKMIYSQAQDAMSALPAAALASPDAITVCSDPTFYLSVYDSLFSAACLTGGARLIGSVRDPAGRVTTMHDSIVPLTGSIDLAFFAGAGGYSGLVPGYTVTFKEYVGGVLTATFRTKVPNIKFASINKAGAVVSGTGPAGKWARLYWSHEKWDAAQGRTEVYKERWISSSGTWQVDFGTAPIRGGDFLSAYVYAATNFHFTRDMVVPFLYCQLGGNYCEVAGYPFTPATIQVIHGGQTYTFSGTFDAWGYFGASLKTPIGMPILLKAYDKVSGTGVAQYALPNLTTNLNYTADTVTGKAPAYKYFDLWLFDADAHWWSKIYAHSNGAGTYAGNFMTAYGVNLLAGHPYIAEVYYVLPSTGNGTDLYRVWGP